MVLRNYDSDNVSPTVNCQPGYSRRGLVELIRVLCTRAVLREIVFERTLYLYGARCVLARVLC
jgi:hypothetical protein